MDRGTRESAPLLQPARSDVAFASNNLNSHYKDYADEPQRPWFERPVRICVGGLFFVLVAGSLVPFILEMMSGFESNFVEQLSDKWSYIEPVLLAVLTLLAAVAGSHTHGKKEHPMSGKAAHLMVHAVNLAPLIAAVISWWPGLPITVDAFSNLAETLAYVAGVTCRIDMGLTMLPIARESPWLNAAGVAFPEGIPFHRITGWWCVAQVVIHSVAEVCAVMSENWGGGEQTHQGPANASHWECAWSAVPVFVFPWVERLDDETGKQELNSEGLVNFCGVLGLVAAVTLAVFALPWIRRRFYDWFYNVHVPAGLFFVAMAVFHNFPMQMFVVPGLVSYFLDRTDVLGRTATNRHRTGTASVKILTDEWVRLDIKLDVLKRKGTQTIKGSINNYYEESRHDNVGSLRSEGAVGTHWMYIRVPSINGEWHPFSLCDRTASVIIKAAGDWTKRLHAACTDVCAEGVDGHQLAVEVDGVYGNASPPWRPYKRVLLIGGGVGVTPWIPMMDTNIAAAAAAAAAVDADADNGDDHSCDAAGLEFQQCSLIWVARDKKEHAAMAPWLPSVRTKIYLTRESPEAVADIAAAANSGVSAAIPASVVEAASRSKVQHSIGRPAFVALISILAMAAAYGTYYITVLLPDKKEDAMFDDDDDGSSGGNGSNGTNGTGNNGSTPGAAMPWEPTTLWSYFLVKQFAPVAFTALAIVTATVFGRLLTPFIAGTQWKFRCPFPTGVSPSSRGALTRSRAASQIDIGGGSGGGDPVAIGASDCCSAILEKNSNSDDGETLVAMPRTLGGGVGGCSPELQNGRPDFKTLVSQMAAEAAAASGAAAPATSEGRRSNNNGSTGGACSGTANPRGLFVCVCGPPGMVRTVQAAVVAAKAEYKGRMEIGFHAEQPAW